MEQQRCHLVSTRNLIPVVKELLDEGNQVKFMVSGDSMHPWIVNGRDLVLLAGIDARPLSKGDIILFMHNQKYILHRIYKKSIGGFLTMGDAYMQSDGLVTEADIIGKVVKIYRKDKEIDCNSLSWKAVSTIWIVLLPFRRQILRYYPDILQYIRKLSGTHQKNGV